MGWERRQRGGLYYTRSRREGGRVVREYLGAGLVAQLAAAMDAEGRVEAQALRDKLTAERAGLLEADARVRAFEAGARKLLGEVLTKHGYHQHKGQWRRRRREA